MVSYRPFNEHVRSLKLFGELSSIHFKVTYSIGHEKWGLRCLLIELSSSCRLIKREINGIKARTQKIGSISVYLLYKFESSIPSTQQTTCVMLSNQ
jgi:hypothetical protein